MALIITDSASDVGSRIVLPGLKDKELKSAVLLPVSSATRISLIIADAIVVAVTWRKTFRHSREAAELGMRTSVSATLLRDGVYIFQLIVLCDT